MTPLFTVFNFACDFRVTPYLSGDELREIHILFLGKYGMCITLVALIYTYVFQDLDKALKIQCLKRVAPRQEFLLFATKKLLNETGRPQGHVQQGLQECRTSNVTVYPEPFNFFSYENSRIHRRGSW